MDLTTEAIHDVIHPTAIYSSPIERLLPAEPPTGEPEPSWEDSQLNPKNRILSLTPLKSPLWSIDGGAGRGTQFFAVPLFLEDAPPMRFDVFVAEKATESPLIRELLDLDFAFHARDSTRVRQQAISSYITRALQVWTTEVYGLDKVKELYYNQPFATRILFENLPLDVRDVQIHIGSMHNLEFHQCSVRELANMWKMGLDEMPQTVDIYSLAYVRQLQDSVCVVRYRQHEEHSAVDQQDDVSRGVWALKALTSSVKYMYHELRNLLTMPPHPNVLSRPVRLVTKKARSNDKREVVIGFLEPYHSGMNLRDSLPLLRKNKRLHLEDQVRWAKEVCSGLLHIRQKGKLYYPDMRLDQIVMTPDNKHPVILDFEQRGVWCEFAAPEVNALEHIRLIASDEDDDEEDDSYVVLPKDSQAAADKHDNHTLRKRYADLLTRLFPGWEELGGHDNHYTNPAHGYNVPWICLTEREREYAEVYMLARVLWCIFEGMSAPQPGAVWQSYRNEPEFEFPSFKLTPPELRGLIDRCTRGRRPQLSGLVTRSASKIVLQGRDHHHHDITREEEIREVRSVAKAFWEHEVEWAEGFLLDREDRMKKGTWDENIFGRPTLEEVDTALGAFQRKLMGDD
ncbi:hypothetical protein VPNG_00091 [Cytospora leucostoma]|uniref:Protein kinase domain-containing protein n=1 Tax=Cytospora leucostoma TaxID=1230097 RepID=A0A423XN29_9PEZI|nr:hypothetical protein VPNG_00091 [Cytospora leucostoma]